MYMTIQIVDCMKDQSILSFNYLLQEYLHRFCDDHVLIDYLTVSY